MRKLLVALSACALIITTSCKKEEKPVETPAATSTGVYKYSKNGNVSATTWYTQNTQINNPNDPINTCWVFEGMAEYMSYDSSDNADYSIKITSDNKLTFMIQGYPFTTIQAIRTSDGGYLVTSDMLSIPVTTKYKVVGNQLIELNSYAAVQYGEGENASYSRYVMPVGDLTPADAVRDNADEGYYQIALKTFERVYVKQ